MDPSGSETDGGGGDSGDGTTGGQGADDPAPPTQATVNNVDLSQCAGQVGCFSYPGGIPAGPWTAVECFDSPVPAPFRVTDFTFGVGWIDSSFDQLDVIVYERGGNGLPADSVYVGSWFGMPTTGLNELGFDSAPIVQTDGFCVALRIPDGGWDGGLSFATNESGPPSGASWYGNCGVSQWTGLSAESWCIGADVSAVPPP
jgi:hypothetical protein